MAFLRIVFLILLASCGASAQLMQEINEFYKKGYSASTPASGSGSSSAPVSEVPINQASTIPNLNSLLGNNLLLPQIEIRGLTNFRSSRRFYGDVKLFTSAFAQRRVSNVSIFFPETSTYGISMSINALPFGRITDVGQNNERTEVNWFCTYFHFNYLGKNLQGIRGTDTTRFTTDVVHFKLGVQLIPVKNFVSVYTDLNFVSPVVNRSPLLEFNPAMKRGFNNFWKIGAKFYLEKGEQKPLSVFLDLGAVAVGRAARTIYDTRDALIPRITLGGSVRF
ncbi:hypothetical protein [Tellurirhabdus rosea]|uniref:hypothetical protein n=1 Tax=Tellurirhabdus rosea TaxID=2674997 RepID=UPI00225B720B|nr:hypothetical protein [Tellurirhabdus rosea]